jgi:hypothetical protein
VNEKRLEDFIQPLRRLGDAFQSVAQAMRQLAYTIEQMPKMPDKPLEPLEDEDVQD